jgi:hypothetical protein
MTEPAEQANLTIFGHVGIREPSPTALALGFNPAYILRAVSTLNTGFRRTYSTHSSIV